MRPVVALVTGNAPRHAWLACQLAAADDVQLSAVITEDKVDPVAAATISNGEDAELLADHFRLRDDVERRHAGSGSWPDVERLRVPQGGTNLPAANELLLRAAPHIIVLFGCGLVSAELLARWPNRVVNVHMGLSPWFRGSGTNFWPLVEGLPECVGVTIHLATERVDHGRVLSQLRPKLAPSDECHSAGLRSLAAAADVLPMLLKHFCAGALLAQAPRPADRPTYRRADLTGAAVRKLRENLSDGMISRFLENESARVQQYPLLEPAFA